MHTYHVQIDWTGNNGEGTRSYTAYRRDHTIASPGKPVIPASSDPAFRGDRARYNPEELLVASLSSCHMLWYLHLCAVNQVIVLEYRDAASGVMSIAPDGSGRFVRVLLRPHVTIAAGSDPAKALALHSDAHRMCFIANSVNFPVDHEPSVAGLPGRRAVFLDRDGVLNEAAVRDGKPFAPTRLADLKIYPEAAPALARLKAAGFLLIVVTNQPDVARGQQTLEVINQMDAAVRAALPVDDIFVCWHDDPDNCHCRKPKPGLILDAAARYGIDLAASFMVGDRWRDIDCGANAGVRTVLIDRHWQERAPDHPPDFRAAGIAEAADCILAAVHVP